MSKKILYVAEPRVNLDLIVMMVKSQGHSIDTANNYDSAKKSIESTKYDDIFIETNDLRSNVEKIDCNEEDIMDFKSEYFGKKLLTDIIRKENSLNYKTFTNIILDLHKMPNQLFSEDDYIGNGANLVLYKFESIPEDLPILIEIQTP